MLVAYVTLTLVAVVLVGSAAVMNLIGHDYPKRQADLVRVPRSWVYPLGMLLGLGALGLVAGFVVPVLGVLAAGGLVLYFLGALIAHLRVRDRHFAPWTLYFLAAVAALVVNLAHLAG